MRRNRGGFRPVAKKGQSPNPPKQVPKNPASVSPRQPRVVIIRDERER